MIKKVEVSLASGAAIGLLTLAAAWLLPLSAGRMTAVLLLVGFFPGWAMIEAVFSLLKERPPLEERLLLGIGSSYVITVLGGLWLYYALGNLSRAPLFILYLMVMVVGFGFAISRQLLGTTPPTSKSQLNRPDVLVLVAILLFAAYFRFHNLYFSDYRGDEAELLIRAVDVITGQGNPVFSHTKGPTEIIITTVFAVMYGAFGELSDRITFAVANQAAVAAVYFTGYRLMGRRVAVIAGLLVAIDGWFIAFSRIAPQYQSVVLLMTSLSVWSCIHFYQGRSHFYHTLACMFAVAGFLGHWGAASVGLPFVYLLILSMKARRQWFNQADFQLNRWLPVGLSILLGLLLLGSFYLPYYLNPAIQKTQNYLTGHIGAEQPYNNFDIFYINGLMYNSIYYIWGVGAVLFGGILRGMYVVWGKHRRGIIAVAVTMLLLPLSYTGILPNLYGCAIFLGVLALFIFSRRVQTPIKILLWWLFLPFIMYIFFTIRPGNHYYVYMPPLLLLAACTIDWLLRRLQYNFPLPARWTVPAVAGGLAILLGLSAWYQQTVYLRTDLEYLLTYPAHRNPVFWSDPRYPFKIRIGNAFPHRLGWQTVSDLYRRGELQGDWYGNDRDNALQWYTLNQPRNPCFPQYFMLTEIDHVVPPLPIPQDTIDRYYRLKATVTVNNQPRLRLYQFAPTGRQIEPVVYREPLTNTTPYLPEMFLPDWTRGSQTRPAVSFPAPRPFKPHPEMLNQLAVVYNDPNVVKFTEQVSLLGYDLDVTYAQPGGVVILTLYWQADSPVFLPYKIFTHLEKDGRLWAQADDEPACGTSPTYDWRPGDKIMDRHAIFLPADIPPGEYPLAVGLYELRSGLRMDVLDEAGNPAGNWLTLPPVTIR